MNNNFENPNEYTEYDLTNVIAGTNQTLAEKKAIENEHLYRQQKIKELKQQKSEVESTLENVDNEIKRM